MRERTERDNTLSIIGPIPFQGVVHISLVSPLNPPVLNKIMWNIGQLYNFIQTFGEKLLYFLKDKEYKFQNLDLDYCII